MIYYKADMQSKTKVEDKSNIVESLDVRSLKVIGLWQLIISSRKGTNDSGVKYFVVVNCVLMALILPYVLMQLVSFGQQYDFIVLMEKISVDTTLAESIIKFFYFWKQRWHLGRLSQVFDIDFMRCTTHDIMNSERILNESSRILTNNINIFIVVIYATVAVWNSLPIFRCLAENQCLDLSIMPSWYPVSVTDTPIKQLVYTSEFIIMCYCASLLYNINCLLLAYARLLASQVRVLKLNLTNIQVNAKMLLGISIERDKTVPECNFNDRRKIDSTMENLLRDCLTDHQKILRFAALMEKVFSPLFLFQMIVSTLTLCLVGLSLTARTTNSANSTMSLAMAFKFIMYFCFGVMELLVYSYCGHIILEETKSLHTTFYETTWITASAKFRKNILIATIKTVRPSFFTAGKFCDIDLGTFTSVMKASCSYFTFLHGINSNK